MKLTHREQRLKLVWILVIPFFVFAKPTPSLLFSGGVLSALGLLLRAWAAGSIFKDQALAVRGPYRFVRHPLYSGSFLLGIGLLTASGSWGLGVLFLTFFAWSYSRTLREEQETLEERFGREYAEYRASVPAFFPKLRRGPPPAGSVERFRWSLYLHNREWQAALGTVAGFAILVLKLLANSAP